MLIQANLQFLTRYRCIKVLIEKGGVKSYHKMLIFVPQLIEPHAKNISQGT
jgi:hypothetical protein